MNKKLTEEERKKRLKELGFKEVKISKEELKEWKKQSQELWEFAISDCHQVIFPQSLYIKLDEASMDDYQNLALNMTDHVTGISMRIVKEVIKKCLPAIANPSTITIKEIVNFDYIHRIGGPSTLEITIKIHLAGLLPEIDDRNKIQGLYRAEIIKHDNHDYSILIEKFALGSKIYEGKLPC